MKHFFFFAVIFPAALSCVNAQTIADSAFYRTNPVWISMMNDRNVNYHEAVSAFEIFWADREKPAETDEAFEMVRENNTEHPVEQEPSADHMLYAADYRKFIYWKHTMLPFVKPDGTLLTAIERIEKHRQRK